MNYHNGFLNNDKGVSLFYQSWISPDPRATIIIIHGVGEHSGRYKEFAQYLVDNNISVCTFDLKGYGRSGGKKGHIDSFVDFTSDVKLFIDFVKNKFVNNKKLFLLGHSLGALIAIKYLHFYHDHPITGVILSGPPFSLNISVSAWLRRACVLFSSILPAMTIKEKSIQLNMLTHDKEKLEEFRRDPARHYVRSLQFIREYFKAEKETFNAAQYLSIPLLIIQGGDDDVIDVNKVKDFYHNLYVGDKMLIVYPDMYHEVLNEIDRSRVYSDVKYWLEQRS